MKRVYFTWDGQRKPLCGGDIFVSSSEVENPRAIVNLRVYFGLCIPLPAISIDIWTLGNAAWG